MMQYLIFALMLCQLTSVANAGGVNVGNAGDWRKTLLTQAKRSAANWTNSAALNIQTIDQDGGISKDSIAYRFMTHPTVLPQLATDIITSEHLYNSEIDTISGEYTSCAWTNDPKRSKLTDIVFSLKLCEGGLALEGLNYANRLLIHESVHHLLLNQSLRNAVGANFPGDVEVMKQKEDELCDEIAASIQKTFEAISRRQKTRWQDIAGPFLLGTEQISLAARGYHASVWTGKTGDIKTQEKMIVWGGCNQGAGSLISCGADGYLGDGGIYDSTTDKWSLINFVGTPSPRAEAASLWIGPSAPKDVQNQFVVWGGCVNGDGCEKKLGDGALYNPALDTWTPIASGNAPAPRVHHTMIWTGKQLIVWGGHPQDTAPYFAKPLNDGSAYDPQAKNWRDLPPPTFSDGTTFAARGHHHAFWTGDTGNSLTKNKMLVFGGCVMDVADRCPQPLGDGAVYDPESQVWNRLFTSGPTPSARHAASVLYVEAQHKLYIFGGFDSRSNFLSNGSILDLETLAWTPMAHNPDGRAMHTAVWANDRMLVFGGIKSEFSGTASYEERVLAYTPGNATTGKNGYWQNVSTDELVPLKTIHHRAFWTGDSMLVWGGQTSDRQFTNVGSRLFLNLFEE